MPRKNHSSLKAKLARIRLLWCDVDGVLTDSPLNTMDRSQRRRLGQACLLGVVLGWALLPGRAPAQLGVVKDFKYPEFYEQKPGGSKQALKTLVTGAEARPQLSGWVALKQMRIESYSEEGKTNLIIRAPECLFNTGGRVASSAGSLQMQTADDRFHIQGQGFLCYLTNFSLLISNQVQTTVHRDLLKAAGSPGGGPGVALSSPASLSNQVMRIYADHFRFDNPSNLITYSHQVRVEDPQMNLTCETLILTRTPSGNVGSIVAEEKVILLGQTDQSRAYGDRAVYLAEKDIVILTGQDARWEDDQRQGRAGSFTFDRKQQTIRAEPRAWMKLRRDTAGSTDWLLSARPPRPAAAALPTNQVIEISSDILDLQLPSTNRPTRTVAGQGHVVIVSPGDQSRATGDSAVYQEEAGTLELKGHAEWQSGERVMRGNALLFDRTNRVFSSKQNAYLKLPQRGLGPSALLDSSVPSGGGTPRFLEVLADDLDYRDGLLTFRENVRGKLLEGTATRGGFTCRTLEVRISNQVDRIVARQSVAMEQLPFVTTDGRSLSKALTCDTFTAFFFTNGMVREVWAEGQVVAQQHERRPGQPAPLHTKLEADSVQVEFDSRTNEVQSLVAQRNVVLTREPRRAQGDKAVYTRSTQLLVLTGHPTAEVSEARITKTDALVWDHVLNRLSARGQTVAEGTVAKRGTNQSGVRLLK